MTKARDLANSAAAFASVSATELGYVDGVTSAIQTQIDTKAPSSTAATLTGTQTLTNKTIDTASNTITGAVTLTGTQTLTNKTLTSPVIASVINNTLTSTTGDIIYASAANTPARLGIGSSAQVLTVAAGVPTWATPAAGGGMTLLSTTTMSGATTTVSSISQSYKNLYIEINSMSVTAFNPTINYLTNAAAVIIYGQQAAAATGVNYYSTAGTLGNAQNYANLSTNNKANWTIFDYTDAANNKPSFFNQRWINEGGSPIYFQGGMATSHTAAVTSISMTVSTGTFNGGSIKIYGVN